MKPLLILIMATAFTIGFSATVFAGISGSEHDFSNETWAQGQVCLPCHAPHNAPGGTDVPLWNHALTSATYTLYSSATLDAAPGQPSGVSKLCLSCHDGTVAVDSFGGETGSIFLAGDENIGTDLSDDHPISIVYDDALATQDGDLFAPSTTPSGIPGSNGTIQTDMLFNGSLECASCHDVHNSNNFDDLTLKSNVGSALCLTCHNK